MDSRAVQALFSFDARRMDNAVTSTIWYDPADRAGPVICTPGNMLVGSRRTRSGPARRDTWAVCKLWTNWRAPVDLRLRSKAGTSTAAVMPAERSGRSQQSWHAPKPSPDQVERITLKMPCDKFTTGYQLAVALRQGRKAP